MLNKPAFKQKAAHVDDEQAKSVLTYQVAKDRVLKYFPNIRENKGYDAEPKDRPTNIPERDFSCIRIGSFEEPSFPRSLCSAGPKQMIIEAHRDESMRLLNDDRGTIRKPFTSHRTRTSPQHPRILHSHPLHYLPLELPFISHLNPLRPLNIERYIFRISSFRSRSHEIPSQFILACIAYVGTVEEGGR